MSRAWVSLTDTLARMWVILVWVGAHRWILTFATTCTIIVVFPFTTFLHLTTLAFAGCPVKVLIVWAGLVFSTFTTATLTIEVLTRVAGIGLADTPTHVWIILEWCITYWSVATLTIACIVVVISPCGAVIDSLALALTGCIIEEFIP
jgi:hypothetical protein